MAFQQLCLATFLSVAIVVFSTSAKADSSAWKQYSDSGQRFLIQYPGTTRAETIPAKEPGLLYRVAFGFEQEYHQGEDAGSLKFRFQISIWQNTNHLSAEAWVKQNLKPQFTVETRSVQISGRKGVMVKTTNLAWTTVKFFVVDQDCLYELSYLDVAANKLLLPDDTRAHWAAVFARMLESFRILSPGGASK